MKNFTAPGSRSSGTGSSGAAAAVFEQKIKPFFQTETVTLYCGDCRGIVPYLDEPVNLVLTDPPYSRVRSESWDQINQSELFRLLDELFRAVRPKLAHNAALYVYAWPTLAGVIEHIMTRHFNILQQIVWSKQDADGRKNGSVNKQHIPGLRNFCPETERIIFAEAIGAGEMYERTTRGLGNHVFQPLIVFFQQARKASGLSGAEIRAKMYELTGKRYVFERHAFSVSQWEFPAREQFLAAATFLPLGDHGEALKSYSEALRRYRELCRRWEHLKRPHTAKKRNFTDLWHYRPILPGQVRFHPCQKPADMIRDMIETSSRPGDLVLDCFAGSGEVGIQAAAAGRRAVLIEQDPDMCEVIAGRLA